MSNKCGGGTKIMEIADLLYRGEGNSSLVIANTKNNKVYKLRKKNKTDCNVRNTDVEGSFEKCRRMLAYSERVLRPLLGEQFVPIAEIVPISKDLVKDIQEKVRISRPSKRQETDIDDDGNYAICLPDLCFIQPWNTKNTNPVFCIEIKPKMGFKPDSQQICDERSIKKSACRFCMYQKMKVEKIGTWDSASLYCPLDLFSGNKERMLYALSCLVKTPQNNLRIFKNGQLIFANNGRYAPTSRDHQQLIDHLKSHFASTETPGEDSLSDLNHSCLQNFLHLIQKILVVSEETSDVRALPNQQPHTTSQCLASNYKPNTQDKSVGLLPSDCILDRILEVQKLDDLDIEGIYPLYQSLQHHLSQHPEDSEKYCLEGPFSENFMKQIPSILQCNSGRISEPKLEYGVQKIREFLIAATAKDCSIMLAIQQTTDTQMDDSIPHISSSNGKKFAYQCRIVDLDPKPSTRIPMYYKLDLDIIQYYKKFCEKQNTIS